MRYSSFGATGETVSALGMGGMRFHDKNVSEKEYADIIRYANEKGVAFFDTAPDYNDDRSEAIYGRALKHMPTDTWTIATKGFNTKSAKEINRAIETSLTRLAVDMIDYYFLWCIVSKEEYDRAKAPGGALEGILRAKEKGRIKHIGVSTHTYSPMIQEIVDDGLFEFIMVPYNALNFREREEGVRYAHDKGLGVVVMNPLYGGVIAEYEKEIALYPERANNAVEDAMAFCLSSPYIDVTLSGMHTKAMVAENVRFAETYGKICVQTLNERQAHIQRAMKGLCTACGYCMPHCPERIPLATYMAVYNAYEFTHSKTAAKERHTWFFKHGPLRGQERTAGKCIGCNACERACTQYLPITARLAFIRDEFENA